MIAVTLLTACSIGGPLVPSPIATPPTSGASVSPPTTTTAPPSTPSPTATPKSEREIARDVTRQLYIDFWKAQDRVAQAGGADEIPPYLDKFFHPESPARDSYLNEVRLTESEEYIREGDARVTDLKIFQMDDLESKNPKILWRACINQQNVKVYKSGKLYEHPRFIVELIEFRRSGAERDWFVYGVQSGAPGSNDGCGV